MNENEIIPPLILHSETQAGEESKKLIKGIKNFNTAYILSKKINSFFNKIKLKKENISKGKCINLNSGARLVAALREQHREIAALVQHMLIQLQQ